MMLLSAIAASCGGSRTATELKPLTGSRAIDLSLVDDGYLLEEVDEASFVLIGRNEAHEHVITRFDTALKPLWESIIPGTNNELVDLAGVHTNEGVLYIPVVQSTDNGGAGYTLQSVELTTGKVREPVSVLRTNMHDVAALENGFDDLAEHKVNAKVVAEWSPDTSKILLQKSYPVGNDRITVEMRLYKKGYSLITRNTVDFRFDQSKQELLGVLPDNDGVAYIFLRNKLDSSFEVGRFEILGSMRLRTIKYKVPDGYALQGKIGVAPRGHAYVAFVSGSQDAGTYIDFDFYQNVATAKNFNIGREKPQLAEPMRFVVDRIATMPDADRNVVLLQEGNVMSDQASGGQLHLLAFDLNSLPVWNTTLANRAADHQSVKRDMLLRKKRDDLLDAFIVANDTMQLHTLDLASGRWKSEETSLAIISGSETLDLASGLVLGKKLYMILEKKLYQLRLP
jgi:hypothetical protein